MQGQLHEIDVCSLLQLIELGQRSGELLINAEGKAWLLSFAHGRIVHAAPVHCKTERLQDFLHRLYPNFGEEYSEGKQPNGKATNSHASSLHLPEYALLWSLLETKKLTLKQGQALVGRLVDETLFDLLSLHTGTFRFEMDITPPAQITTLSIRTHLAKINHQLQSWKQLYPIVEQPDQCPFLVDAGRLSRQVSGKTSQQLARWADGTLSIRQLSRRLNRPMAAVAQAIYPFLEAQLIQLKTAPCHDISFRTQAPETVGASIIQPLPSTPLAAPTAVERTASSPKRWISCIDDGTVTLELLKQMIAPLGHGVLTFSDPLVALGEIFRQPTDLILCDIDMPVLNGYEVCAMLRQTARFQTCPIIMLTSKDGFIDRAQARLAGATDYLTKPLSTDELLMLLEKYIDPGHRL